MVASAVIGAVGAVGGALISSSGAESAASTEANAATQNQNALLSAGREASGMDLGAIGSANAPLAPYANLGANSAGTLSNFLTGIGGGNAQAALDNMPGYQFERQQGLEATQNGFAAKGLGSSGAAIKGAGQYAQGLASGDLTNYYNMLMGGANAGLTAAGQQSQNIANLNQAGANALLGSSTNAASLGMAGAAASAAGQAGAANALGGGINNAAGALSQGVTLSQFISAYNAAHNQTPNGQAANLASGASPQLIAAANASADPLGTLIAGLQGA